MATITVTVNSKPVEQYLSEEKSIEIQQFLRSEMRSFSHTTQRHLTSPVRNASKVHAVGDGRIECR